MCARPPGLAVSGFQPETSDLAAAAGDLPDRTFRGPRLDPSELLSARSASRSSWAFRPPVRRICRVFDLSQTSRQAGAIKSRLGHLVLVVPA